MVQRGCPIALNKVQSGPSIKRIDVMSRSQKRPREARKSEKSRKGWEQSDMVRNEYQRTLWSCGVTDETCREEL